MFTVKSHSRILKVAVLNLLLQETILTVKSQIECFPFQQFCHT